MDRQLSQISYSDILLKATPDDITKIVFEDERIIKPADKKQYDIGFVFGGISMIPYRVDKAIELYNQDIVKRILVSGGIGFMNTDRRTPEADKMLRYLLDYGIPKEDILVERFSRNTNENISHSFNILNQEYGDITGLNYVLITSDFHVRRCLGLFETQLEHGENIIGCGIQDGIKDADNWQKSLAGKKQILMEAIALCMYAKQKRLPDTEIKDLSLNRRRIL